MSNTVAEHTPVLLRESLDLLNVRRGGVYADCTVGLGGHTEGILEALQGSGFLLGLDRDKSALEMVRERLGSPSNLRLCHENFKNLSLVLKGLGVGGLDGCLADLGLSSLQLDTPERGFSFRHDAPLDMRMDVTGSTTAAQLVNRLSEERLAEIFLKYGEERQARKIAAEIVRRRAAAPLRTTGELAELVSWAKGGRRGERIHPATQVFQALRIEVNQELAGLESFLDSAIDAMNPGGRLVVISFHSLEDRAVKRVFRKAAGHCVCFRPPDMCQCPRVQRVRLLTRKPITAERTEIEMNPRARSAKLRAAEKVGSPTERH